MTAIQSPSSPSLRTGLDGRLNGIVLFRLFCLSCIGRFGYFYKLPCLYIVDIPINRNVIRNQRMIPYALDIFYDTSFIIRNGKPVYVVAFG